MKLTVFLDGRPGHEKQSLAIVLALQEMLNVEVQQIHLKSSTSLRRFWDVCRLVIMPDGGCDFCVDDTDLIIGTGSATHATILACKKRFSVPAVTCMTPHWFLRRRFDICFVPRHDATRKAENVFITDGPPVMPVPNMTRDSTYGLILIGGVDVRSHQWNTGEILSYVESVVKEQPDIHWRVSSSPRTPVDFVECMLQLEQKMNNISFFHFKDTPRGWVEEQYARATYVWVTADSMSMMYEAITAGCKVGIFPVKWKKERNKFQNSIEYLSRQGRIVPFEGNSRECFNHCKPGDFNEAKRCAIEIVSRFFKAHPFHL